MPSTTFTTGAATSPSPAADLRALAERWFPLGGRARSILLFVYYLAILIGLLLIYSRGDFATPKFIYQGF